MVERVAVLGRDAQRDLILREGRDVVQRRVARLELLRDGLDDEIVRHRARVIDQIDQESDDRVTELDEF